MRASINEVNVMAQVKTTILSDFSHTHWVNYVEEQKPHLSRRGFCLSD